ncbi:hypothetical protein GC177_05435 [bacterium]|nr:hypothetical protein [bacterium]
MSKFLRFLKEITIGNVVSTIVGVTGTLAIKRFFPEVALKIGEVMQKLVKTMPPSETPGESAKAAEAMTNSLLINLAGSANMLTQFALKRLNNNEHAPLLTDAGRVGASYIGGSAAYQGTTALLYNLEVTRNAMEKIENFMGKLVHGARGLINSSAREEGPSPLDKEIGSLITLSMVPTPGSIPGAALAQMAFDAVACPQK